MERLKQRYQLLQKAVNTLRQVLQKLAPLNVNDDYYLEVRDSVIQRFEYSVDLLWKFLKHFLEEKYATTPPASPKPVFKICLDTNLVTQEEYTKLIEMIEDRNLTSHAYDETLAERIKTAIPQYYNIMKNIVKRHKMLL